MGLSNCRKVLILLTGLLCTSQVWSMTLSKTADHQSAANQLADETSQAPEPSSAASGIKFACPMPETFCVPRTRCAFRSVVYDRETLLFMQGLEKFEDKYGCGAFKPTEYYVCCESKELFGPQIAWNPTSAKWFLLPEDHAAQHGKIGGSSISIPALLPWPAYEEPMESVKDDDQEILEEVHVTESSEPAENLSKVDAVDPALAEKQEAKGGTQHHVDVPHSNPAQSFFPFPNHDLNDPKLIDPLIGMNPMMGQPPMFPTLFNNFNSMFGNPIPPEQPLSSRWVPPRSDWVEMILIFPDGSVQHTIREQRPTSSPLTEQPPTEQPPQAATEAPRSHPAESSAQTAQPTQAAEPATEKSTQTDEGSTTRGRRAIESKTFKVEPARGGLWTGNLTSAEDEREGRALVPPPKAIWGLPGSGTVPILPMSAAFNVNGDRCGISSSSGINARILSGRKPGSEYDAEANMAEFPWHVGIINGETGNYLCGGAIISGRFVVTVAHCVRRHQLSLLFVRVGDWDLSVTSEMFPSYDVEVLKVYVHEDYNAGNMQNDIALLQLKYPLDFVAMPHVGSICLPPGIEQQFTDCIVTGWGQQLPTTEGKADVSTFSRTLKKTSQTLVTHQSCEKSLRPYLGQFYQLPMKGFVCAYDKDGKDSCFGDGGGALACLVNNPSYGKSEQYHVVGLVSWGVGCGIPGVPAVYTNLLHYRDWIHAKVFPIDPYSTDGLKESVQPPVTRHPAIMIRSGKAVDENQVEELDASIQSEETDASSRDFIDLAFN